MDFGSMPAKRGCSVRSGRCQLCRKACEVYPVSAASGKTMILAPEAAAVRAMLSIFAAFSCVIFLRFQAFGGLWSNRHLRFAIDSPSNSPTSSFHATVSHVTGLHGLKTAHARTDLHRLTSTSPNRNLMKSWTPHGLGSTQVYIGPVEHCSLFFPPPLLGKGKRKAYPRSGSKVSNEVYWHLRQ